MNSRITNPSSSTGIEAPLFYNGPSNLHRTAPGAIRTISLHNTNSSSQTVPFVRLIDKWTQSDSKLPGELDSIQITLYYSQITGFSAEIFKGVVLQQKIDQNQINCGIIKKEHHVFFREMHGLLNRDNLCVWSYPSVDKTEEIWVFEAKPSARLNITIGKEELLKKNYSIALKEFGHALTEQNKSGGPTQDLESAISKAREMFLNKKILISSRYLHTEQEEFKKNVLFAIDSCPKGYTVFSYLFETCMKKSQLYHYYLMASLHEHDGDFYCAIDCYRHLALQKYIDSTFNPSSCLKKMRTLCETNEKQEVFLNILESLDRNWLIRCRKQTEDIVLETLILQKDAVRMIFEAQLAQLSKNNNAKKPTCFICHDVSETEVVKWVKHILAPDMRKINIEPRYSSAHLEQGNSITQFEKKITTTSFAVIICTPGLKKKVDERKNTPIGVALEVQLAETRIKKGTGTTFLIYLSGDSSTTCPSVIFDDDLRPNMRIEGLNGVYDYYTKVFELFGKMCGLDRENANNHRDQFLKKAKWVLSGNINVFELEKWRKDKFKPK